MLKLYDLDVSGNCYKARLLLSMLHLEYERVPVNLATGEHLTEKFMKLNPRSEIPVLVDGETVIWDSHAILVYLARRYDSGTWLPADPLLMGRVQQWLAVAGHEIQYGLAAARACLKFGRAGDLQALQQRGSTALNLLDAQLGRSAWLAGEQPTLADIACYPYVRCAGEADVSLRTYSSIGRWFNRIESLPGYVPMLDRAQNVA